MNGVARIELVSGLAAVDVRDRLCVACDQEGWNRRVLAFYLLEMHERRLYLESGHADVRHFGVAFLELEHRRTNELIQIGRALRGLKLLDEAYVAGEVSWSKVGAILPVVQRETQMAWVNFAKTATFRELRDTVRGCRPGDLPEDADKFGQIRKKRAIHAELSDRGHARFEIARQLFSTDPEHPLSDSEVIEEFAVRIIGDPESHEADPTRVLPYAERNHDPIPAEIRQDVLARDHHRCCNCHSPNAVEVHHIEHREHGGDNSPANLITLCRTCHGLIHGDYLRIDQNPQLQSFTFLSQAGHPTDQPGVRTPARDSVPAPSPSLSPARAHPA